MVKTETSHERRELLKIMQASADTSALKSFVRYKGLDLLWSWMIDASSENRNKYRYEVSFHHNYFQLQLIICYSRFPALLMLLLLLLKF